MNDCDLISSKIQDVLQPSAVRVINTSHMHAGHASSPNSGRSHFRVEVQSEALNALPRVRAHQQIYQILDAELKSHIHALEIVLLKS